MPFSDPDPLRASAAALARLVRERRLSSLELVDAHIQRIEAVNRRINALVADRFERARQEARAADDRIAAGAADLPPLWGVPVTIKEFLAVDGMPHTGGLLARRDVRATGDATVVARMRAAGAIVLGVSNVPEGGMWMETYNKIWGRTNNPWNLLHTAGGSSGGEGALVAAGCSPLGIGSDIAGSVRIPAAFCGVYGHKPTARMVPNTGMWGVDGGTQVYLTAGPLARSVTDLDLALSVIAGPDGRDRYTRPWTMPDWHDRPLSEVVVYPLDAAQARVRPEAAAEVRRAARILADRGATVREPSVRLVRHMRAIWTRAMEDAGEGGADFATILGDGRRIGLWRETARTLLGRSRVTVPALALAIFQAADRKLGRRMSRSGAEAGALQRELEALVGERGVILHPPYTRAAPRHDAALLTPFDFVCTALFSIAEMPATVAPMGTDRRGLPLGVQIAARRGNDRLCLRVAAALEEATGGWTPAPL